jgi:pyruvate/2-oxoglutarate dehydrogenase complex dihydrolipoamide dehydrogenase (E3) component
MNNSQFTIKNVKTWSTDDGGGYQFSLYVDGKKFAIVTNDGWGGTVNVDCIFKSQLESLVQYVSQFKVEYEGQTFDKTLDIFMDELLNEYEMNKKLQRAKKKGIAFKLLTDSKDVFRTLNVLDMEKAKAYLDAKFPNNYQII